MPALYEAWDQASLKGQAAHLTANRSLLILLVVGAAVGAIPALLEGQVAIASLDIARKAAAVVSAGLFAMSLWLTSTLRSERKADTWYDGRALAESAKSMAWKFMMHAEPYGSSLTAAEVDGLFCADLHRLLTDAGQHTLRAASDAADGDEITQKMREVRARSLQERLDLYQQDRIATQRAWYKKRSAEHEKAATKWFWAVVILNLAALALSLAAIFSTVAAALVAVATTATSAGIAWSQTRRHSDLAHSYSFTSHEMGLLQPKAKAAQTQDDLARFVADCETAISREHTMWRARRETA